MNALHFPSYSLSRGRGTESEALQGEATSEVITNNMRNL